MSKLGSGVAMVTASAVEVSVTLGINIPLFVELISKTEETSPFAPVLFTPRLVEPKMPTDCEKTEDGRQKTEEKRRKQDN